MSRPGLRCTIAFLCLAAFSTSLPAQQDVAITPASTKDKAPAKEYLLRYKFVPGQSVYYEVTQKMEMLTTFKQVTQKQTNDVWERKHYKVVKVEADGTGELETVIDQVKMQAVADDRKINYDSTNPTDDIPVAFRGIVQEVGKPQVRVRMSSQGNLLTLSRLNEDGKAGPKVSADAIPETDPSHNFLVAFPEKAVKVGDTWNEEMKVKVTLTREIQRDIKLLRTFELLSVKDNIASIRSVTSIQGPSKNPSVLAQLIQRTPSGTIKFDMTKGQIIGREMKTDRSVVNGLGQNTVFRAVSLRSEKIADAPTDTTTK